MNSGPEIDAQNLEIAKRWCTAKGEGWSVRDQAGRGGTAPVFSIQSPQEKLALKIYDAKFSTGDKAKIEEKRIDEQKKLGVHECPYLVKIYDGGRFEDRFFLLMNRAPGQELEKRLADIPRSKVHTIVDQVARACMFLRSKGICHRDIKSANIFISNDFEHATLLDLSVTRDIYDPVGVGTDHDGQLPVVATARYSPPEYLFRLTEAGSELWHALDIYQLGGLLHDLIMRQPLFQSEYQKSNENRYRFAWIVATVDPTIDSDEVDHDLIFLARRALDKNWQRRSTLTLDKFLAGNDVHRLRALNVLGLSRGGAPPQSKPGIGGTLWKVSEVARDLETAILERLRSLGVKAQHFVDPGDGDLQKILRFVWDPGRAGPGLASGNVEYRFVIAMCEHANRSVFECSAMLSAVIEDERREVSLDLPDVNDDAEVVRHLAEQAQSSVEILASDLMQARAAS
jgi:serine/threonine protein kinase